MDCRQTLLEESAGAASPDYRRRLDSRLHLDGTEALLKGFLA